MRSTPLYIGEEEEFALAHVLFVFLQNARGRRQGICAIRHILWYVF